MKKIFIIISILLFSFNAYCQHGYNIDFQHVATITFPNTPKSQTTKAGVLYTYAENERLYIAQASIIKKRGVDLFKSHLDDSIYAGVITGSLQRSQGKLVYKKNIEANGISGVEFCYLAKIGDVNYYRYHQTFYFNNVLVLYGYWSPDSLKANDKDLRTFFGTFKLTIKDEEVRQGNASELGYKTGEIIGVLLIIGIVVLLGFGVVYIIKKITYK
jgi:hypothetical protein